MKHPLGMVALLYASGLLLAEFTHVPLPVLFFAALALALAALLLARFRLVLLWPFIVLTGWTNFASRTTVISPNDLRVLLGNSPTNITVIGVLCDTPTRNVYLRSSGQESIHSQAKVDVTAIRHGSDWLPAAGRIIVATAQGLPANFFAGQPVEISGTIAPPPEPVAEGLFDYKAYLRRQGIYFRLQARSEQDWHLRFSQASAPKIDRFRDWGRHALALGLPQEDESLRLEYALTLGDKKVLTDAVSEPFVRSATYHIFAVDGLRMAILFGIFFTMFRILRIPRPWAGLALVALIWFYVAFTGWPASAIRAAVMLNIVILGWALKRPPDLLNSLFAAALVILLWDPQELFEAGFQLSFFVVLCIVLIMPAFDSFAVRLMKTDPLLPESLRPRWQKAALIPARYLLDLLMTSLAAWLGSIPLVAYYFHIVTPISGPANVIAVPLCALVLLSNFLSLGLASWLPAGAEILNHAGWFLMECIRVASAWFAKLPHAAFYVAEPSLFTMGLYYLLLIALFTGWLFKVPWRRWKIAGMASLIAFWCFQHFSGRGTVQITVLPVEDGSAVFCDAADGRALIDCGNKDPARFITVPFLEAQGVNSLSVFALSCGEARQTGGALALANRFSPGCVDIGPGSSHSRPYQQAVDALKAGPVRLRTVFSGDHLDGHWRMLYPDIAHLFDQAENNSMVLLGDFDGTRILLLSNLGEDGQAALMQQVKNLRADIVVAGVPTKGEPFSAPLMPFIAPDLIIITDSTFAARWHGRADMLDRLKRYGRPVYYTPNCGAVKISLHGNGWSARTMSGLHWERK